jgi:serine/threonine protein kinase/Tol biopolymer transport system component
MTDPKTRLESVLSARYRLGRELGRGGMATVYLAHDIRHDRDVALKVLHPELGAVIGAERFLAEIKVTARLQHPHILGLIDSGEADGLLFYVMPFVSGESLRVKIQREKQLSIPEALRIATEVASALNYAHRQGVVHRDIKPENILLHDGQALVADFGIALAVTSAGGGRMTQTGMSLGTPHYMSPEQAMGERDITARSDVYALGAMTYEMLTGDPPFTGSTNQAITAKVLTERPPPPRTVRDTVPPHVETAILVALAKLPADRWESTKEFSDALANPALTAGRHVTAATAAYPGGALSARPPVRLSALVALATLVLGAAAGWLLRRPAPVATFPVEFSIEPDSSHTFDSEVTSSLAISPDGTRLVYVGRTTQRMLYLRGLGDITARPLPGSEGASDPFFSPDGQWIAFEANRALKKIPVAGGAPVTIVANATDIWGGSWGADGSLVYSGGSPSGLFRVSADGGTPERLTQPETTAEERSGFPVHLPDGNILFTALRRSQTGEVIARLGVKPPSGPEKYLDVPGFAPRYLATGEILYALADGTLLAQRFDAGRLELTGTPRQVASGLRLALNILPVFTASPNGVLVLRPGSSDAGSAVVMRPGGGERVLFTAPGLWSPRYSPDGRRIAYARTPQDRTPGGRDIWVYSLADGTSSRLTAGLQGAVDPAWSPDGTRIVFSANRADADLMSITSSGGEDPRVELEDEGPQYQAVFHPDGKRILFASAARGDVSDVYALRLEPGAAAEPVLNSRFIEQAPAVSPDGKWLAYQSNETGSVEVYVRPLAGAGSRVLVSAGGGREPAWDRTGQVLYYRSATRLMAARVATAGGLAVLERQTVIDAATIAGRGNRNYDVAPDGSGFLMLKSATTPRMHVRVMATTGVP